MWELVLDTQVRLYLVVCNLLQIKNMHWRRKKVFSQVSVCFHFQSFVIFVYLLFLNRHQRSFLFSLLIWGWECRVLEMRPIIEFFFEVTFILRYNLQLNKSEVQSLMNFCTYFFSTSILFNFYSFILYSWRDKSYNLEECYTQCRFLDFNLIWTPQYHMTVFLSISRSAFLFYSFNTYLNLCHYPQGFFLTISILLFIVMLPLTSPRK